MTAVPAGLVVLLADDDSNDVFLIRRAFKQTVRGARIFEVRDGDQVISYLEGTGLYSDRSLWPLPRILVLDQWIPRLSGSEVLGWIRSDPRFTTLPVLMMTAGVPAAPGELMDKFKAAYCVKSLEPKKMQEELRTALATALRLVWQSPLAHHSTLFSMPPTSSVSLKLRSESSELRP